jgi:hypothetical protein
MSPRIPIFTFFKGIFFPEAAIASSVALTRPKQHGTSIWGSVMLLMEFALKIWVNFSL